MLEGESINELHKNGRGIGITIPFESELAQSKPVGVYVRTYVRLCSAMPPARWEKEEGRASGPGADATASFPGRVTGAAAPAPHLLSLLCLTRWHRIRNSDQCREGEGRRSGFFRSRDAGQVNRDVIADDNHR